MRVRRQRTIPPSRWSAYRRRPAFTLTEMLVAVALVILMMLLFAQIFQLATGSMSTQRAIAENDQRARSVTTILRADLDKRTIRNAVPFLPGEDSSSLTPFSDRTGYFYISENDPDDATDDVLQFTVRATIVTRNTDATPYFGRGVRLPGTTLYDDPNQPEADDGQLNLNSTASSTAAEISYYLRGGKLYRRILLIRDPLDIAGADSQPTDNNSADADPRNRDLFNYQLASVAPARFAATDDFWAKFDFSAHYRPSEGARFNGLGALVNEIPGNTYFPIAHPKFRFGHNHTNGIPREFLSVPNGKFLGRFTQEETSHGHFNYPQGPSLQNDDPNTPISDGNPMSYPNNNTAIQLSMTNGVVDQYRTGSRRAEDMLLANVHSFDIEVWDEGHCVDPGDDGQPGLINFDDDGNDTTDDVTELGWPNTDDPCGAFVDVGHSIAYGGYPVGDYNQAQNANTAHLLTYTGPYSSVPYSVDVLPKWRAQTPYMKGDVVVPTTPDGFYYTITHNGTSGTTEPTWTNVVGSGIVPADVNGGGIEYIDANGNGSSDSGEETEGWVRGKLTYGPYGSTAPASNRVFDTWHPRIDMYPVPLDGFEAYEPPPFRPLAYPSDLPRWEPNVAYEFGDVVLPTEARGYVFAYRCIAPGTSDQLPPAGAGEPVWPTTLGARSLEDLNGNSEYDAGELVWETVPNLRPLKSIRITIRFLHVSSGSMRQLTLIHSLVD